MGKTAYSCLLAITFARNINNVLIAIFISFLSNKDLLFLLLAIITRASALRDRIEENFWLRGRPRFNLRRYKVMKSDEQTAKCKRAINFPGIQPVVNFQIRFLQKLKIESFYWKYEVKYWAEGLQSSFFLSRNRQNRHCWNIQSAWNNFLWRASNMEKTLAALEFQKGFGDH